MEKFNSSMENIASESGNRQCCRILVAEDYEVNQKVAQLILEKAGFHVEVVADGRQALAAYKENHYDLILMDIQMPVMDGHAATREIRAWELKAQSSKLKADDRGQKTENKFQNTEQNGQMIETESEIRNLKSEIGRVPIIALTGEASVDGFDPQRYPGMDDWVCKPLQRDHLLAIIHKWTSLLSNEAPDQNPVQAVDNPVDRADGKNLPIDLDRALDEFMGKKDILLAVLEQFMNRSGDQIADLRSACGKSDCRAIASDAHRLKGGAANLRADRLARAASDLEKAAENGKTEEICNLIEKLAEEFHHLERFLRQEGV